MAEKKPQLVDAGSYYKIANDYYEKGDYEKAIENYNMAILLNPLFSEAYFNRALSYYQLKNYDKSIADYTEAAELDPKNPIIFNNKGDAFYRKQDYTSAIKDYDKAIMLNPNYLKAYYNRALSYASLEDYEKAVEDFTKVVQLKPDFSEAYHLRGLAFEYAGDVDGAVSDYEKALELNPELAEAKSHLESAKTKKQTAGSGGGGGKEGGTSEIKVLRKPDMNFTDVAGMEKMKEEIREAVIYPMAKPELARKYGKLGGGGIIMYGPPGCGKCVKGNTPVLLADGKIKDIKDIYESHTSQNKKILNENETIIEQPGIEVLSLNKKTLKMEKKDVDFIYRQRYKGKIYEVTTHSGRKISVTPEHPFISISNGAKKTKASELSVGAYVAVPRELKTTPVLEPKVLLKDFRKFENNGQEMLQYCASPNHLHTRSINPIYNLDENTSRYFGLMLSEGSSIYGTMFFSNSNQDLIAQVAQTTEDTFGLSPRIKPDTSEGVYRVEIGSVTLMRFLEEVHGFKLQGSRNTRVPKTVLGAPLKVASSFLSAVFECEACVRGDIPEIEFSTASKQFANELSYLLLRFGIVARIKPKRIKDNDHTYWRIYISTNENLRQFEEKIGFMSKRKISKLKFWTDKGISGHTNTDIIPNIHSLLKETRLASGLNKTEFYGSKNGYRYELQKTMSRNFLKRILGESVSNELKQLRTLAESEVLWDKIVEINVTEVDEYVYDLTIADNHTFVAGFGGLIVHNTYIVKAAAGECDSAFINAKLSDLLDMYVGNTEKNIHKVFETARKNAPCILFFDEIDAIGGRRDAQEGAQYMKMAVNQMLYEMDGVEANNQNVLIIAATNAPWDIDPALRRSGRFGKTLFVPEPDFGSREAIIKIHAKKRPMSKRIPYKRLALATSGYASADLKAIVEEAAAIPWREAFKSGKERNVKTSDFIKAIKKKRSSLPPWYEQANKQIGKQEEITVVDGKEHKKVTDSKMGPGEKEAFRDLLKVIEKRTKWYNKGWLMFLKNVALIVPIPI